MGWRSETTSSSSGRSGALDCKQHLRRSACFLAEPREFLRRQQLMKLNAGEPEDSGRAALVIEGECELLVALVCIAISATGGVRCPEFIAIVTPPSRGNGKSRLGAALAGATRPSKLACR
jgi:hypothetical protein